MTARPTLIAIDPDDHYAEHVGVTEDGRQFILTTPFDPALGNNPGGEFVALYLFDASGRLVEATIDRCGPRNNPDNTQARLYAERLAELGDVSSERVSVAPFTIDKFGLQFGLIVSEPEDEDEEWSVEMQPGNYMAFFAPWDSGEYDT